MTHSIRWSATLLAASFSLTHCGEQAADDPAAEQAVTSQPSTSGTGTAPSLVAGTAPAPAPTAAPSATPTTTAPATSALPSAPTNTPSVPTSGPAPTPTALPSATGAGGTPELPPLGNGGALGGSGAGGSGESPEPGAGGESGAAALGGGGSGAVSAGAGGTPSAGDFVLSSSDFADGEMIPDEFTCDGKAFGEGVSPQLGWSGAPSGTLSFAITFIDTTLTSQMPPDTNGYHWAMWDIPPAVMELPGELPSGATLSDPEGAKQYSPFNPPAYLGPCPSFFEPATDEYAFVLYALDVETLPNPPNNVQELEQLFLDHAIATATLTGTSDATPQ